MCPTGNSNFTMRGSDNSLAAILSYQALFLSPWPQAGMIQKRKKTCQNAESNQAALVFHLLGNSLNGDLGNVCVPDKERLHPKMDLEEVSINVLSWN